MSLFLFFGFLFSFSSGQRALVRLVEASPDGVSAVLSTMIKARVPDFDYKDQLKTLLRALADKGKKQDVISHAERLRSLPGMQELFDRLTRSN